jgi:aquaporin Z
MDSQTTKIIAEFVGTFVFLFVILQSGIYQISESPALQPFVIVLGLLVAIFMVGSVSGGHFNPAVSVMMYLKGNTEVSDLTKLLGYVIIQVLGGAAAYGVHKKLHSN